MDFETKFLVSFYAILGGVTALALVGILLQSQLVAMLLVVIALFAAMAVLAATINSGDAADPDR